VSLSILIVDDEPDVGELFRQRFRREVRQGLYVLHFAYSAEEALEKLDTGVRPQLNRHSHVRVRAGHPPVEQAVRHVRLHEAGNQRR